MQHPAAEAVDVNEIEVHYEPEQASQWPLSFLCTYSSMQEHGQRLRMKADALKQLFVDDAQKQLFVEASEEQKRTLCVLWILVHYCPKC